MMLVPLERDVKLHPFAAPHAIGLPRTDHVYESFEHTTCESQCSATLVHPNLKLPILPNN